MDDDVDFLAWYRLYYLLILWARYRWTRSFKLSDDEKQMVQRIKEKVDIDNKKQGAINVMIYFMMRKF